jgi:hypothetical protein
MFRHICRSALYVRLQDDGTATNHFKKRPLRRRALRPFYLAETNRLFHCGAVRLFSAGTSQQN